MTNYLVIEFDSEEGLQKLRDRIHVETLKGKRFRVAGVFKAPDKWCECPRPEGYHKDEVVRGSNNGWWVHRQCRRAVQGQHHLANKLSIQDSDLPDTQYMHRISTLNVFELLTRKAKRH